MSKTIYRVNGRFAKKGTPGAKAWGVRVGKKLFSKDQVEDITPRVQEKVNDAPELRYTMGGKYINRELAESLIGSDIYKEKVKKKEESFKEAFSRNPDKLMETNAFYDLVRTFENNVDMFGFEELTIQSKTFNTSTFKSKTKAKEALTWLGYEAGKIAKEANKTGSGTPAEVFEVGFYMEENGVFIVKAGF